MTNIRYNSAAKPPPPAPLTTDFRFNVEAIKKQNSIPTIPSPSLRASFDGFLDCLGLFPPIRSYLGTSKIDTVDHVGTLRTLLAC